MVTKKAKDFRALAWEEKKGKWGTLALITLVAGLITGLCGALSSVGIGAILTLVITGPLDVGFCAVTLAVARGGKAEMKNLFNGFKNFLETFLLGLTNSLLIALWSLLLVVPGIVKTYSYRMSYYIIQDNPDMKMNDARKESMRIMKGNKWRLFCLHLSFLGWFILCALTFGILYFWVQPYLKLAETEFYRDLIGEVQGPEGLEQ